MRSASALNSRRESSAVRSHSASSSVYCAMVDWTWRTIARVHRRQTMLVYSAVLGLKWTKPRVQFRNSQHTQTVCSGTDGMYCNILYVGWSLIIQATVFGYSSFYGSTCFWWNGLLIHRLFVCLSAEWAWLKNSCLDSRELRETGGRSTTELIKSWSDPERVLDILSFISGTTS